MYFLFLMNFLITFFLPYFILRNTVYNIAYKICVNELFMLFRILVNSKLLIAVLKESKLYMDFQLCGKSALLTPMFFKGQLYIQLIDSLFSSTMYLLIFGSWIFPFLVKGVKISNYNIGLIYVFLQLCQVLPHVFWCSVIRHIHIKDCHLFLTIDSGIYLSLVIYLFFITLFISLYISFLDLKSTLSEINRDILVFFRLVIAWYIFVCALLLIDICLYT